MAAAPHQIPNGAPEWYEDFLYRILANKQSVWELFRSLERSAARLLGAQTNLQDLRAEIKTLRNRLKHLEQKEVDTSLEEREHWWRHHATKTRIEQVLGEKDPR